MGAAVADLAGWVFKQSGVDTPRSRHSLEGGNPEVCIALSQSVKKWHCKTWPAPLGTVFRPGPICLGDADSLSLDGLANNFKLSFGREGISFY